MELQKLKHCVSNNWYNNPTLFLKFYIFYYFDGFLAIAT